jgi:hypothetical protein
MYVVRLQGTPFRTRPSFPACSYCDHINAAAKQTIEKLHLMEGLQQKA